MTKSAAFKDIFGNDVLTYEYASRLRAEDKEERKKNFIMAQSGGQERILSSQADISITGGSRGGPLEVSTLVRTPRGCKKICNLKKGDIVYGSDGKEQEVVFNESHGYLPSYRIKFRNGEITEYVTASNDHVWSASLSEGGEPMEMTTFQITSLVHGGHSVYIPYFMCGAPGCGKSKLVVAKCEFVGYRQCCCIHVSNDDMLFMLANGILAHNSKSFSILMEGLKDIKNPNFSAIILRNEKPDLENIIEDSKRVYKDYGTYISSDKSMYWDLKTGGRIRFSFHAGDYDDFVTRFQGKQYSYIAIDEITHISWKKFLYLSTCLRNAHGIRNRIVGSCNPDPESWVAEFIAWWIGFPDTVYSDGQIHPERDGLPIPERNGKIRYCFLAGAETISDIVWGDTREEVYEKCREQIAEMWTPDMEEYGDPKDLFILSVSFVESKLTDNKKLLESDPSYLARLANQSEEQRQRDLAGNWHYKSKGDDYLTMEIMENFFRLEPQWGDRKPRAAMDVALQGGDNCWMWLIVGNHIADVDVCQVDSEQLVSHTRNRLRQWGVLEEDFTYDANGIGGLMRGFFKKAVPFNNMEAPYGATEKDRKVAKQDYDTLKSQCLFDLADAIKYGRISISRDLLSKRFSGKGFENRTLREILMEERRCIKVDQEKANRGKGKCLIQKGEMKKIIHRSPDALESLGYSRIFWVKNMKPHGVRPIGAARFSDANGSEGGQRRGNPVRMASAFPRTRYI